MKYCVDTADKGILLKPDKAWDGKDKNFLFEINGQSNSTFASDPATK